MYYVLKVVYIDINNCSQDAVSDFFVDKGHVNMISYDPRNKMKMYSLTFVSVSFTRNCFV